MAALTGPKIVDILIEAHTTASGEVGVISARQQVPDIVVLDHGLPGLNGLDVLRRIRSFSNMPVLVLTGYPHLADEFMAAGANAVMTKPFRPRSLMEHAQDMLAPHEGGA
ncbi:response regulator transcription factor [Arthrobacter nitrophenolicus]|nr:response regulator [Arthrobacter nitrophenolicus]